VQLRGPSCAPGARTSGCSEAGRFRKARNALVLIAVDVVGLEGVESLPCALRDPRLHDRGEDADPADVEPPLARPPVEGTAEHRVREFVLVATEALPGGRVHVTAKAPPSTRASGWGMDLPRFHLGRPSPAPTGAGAPPRSRRRRRPSAAMCVRRCNSKKTSGQTRARGNPGRPEPSSYPKRAGLGREALRLTPRCSPPGTRG
jgi:hypothetical protein